MGEVKDPDRSDEEGKEKGVGWGFGSTDVFPGGLFQLKRTHIHLMLLTCFSNTAHRLFLHTSSASCFSHSVLFLALQLPVGRGMFIPGYVFTMHVSSFQCPQYSKQSFTTSIEFSFSRSHVMALIFIDLSVNIRIWIYPPHFKQINSNSSLLLVESTLCGWIHTILCFPGDALHWSWASTTNPQPSLHPHHTCSPQLTFDLQRWY